VLHQNVEVCWYFYQVSIYPNNFLFPCLSSIKLSSGASSRDLLNTYFNWGLLVYLAIFLANLFKYGNSWKSSESKIDICVLEMKLQ